MKEKITKRNFSPVNRSRTIGNSLYRICREQSDSGKWYIHETYNDGSTFAGNNAFHKKDLQEVMDIFNNFSKEKEVISLRYSCI